MPTGARDWPTGLQQFDGPLHGAGLVFLPTPLAVSLQTQLHHPPTNHLHDHCAQPRVVVGLCDR
jgi:hypothetical protein